MHHSSGACDQLLALESEHRCPHVQLTSLEASAALDGDPGLPLGDSGRPVHSPVAKAISAKKVLAKVTQQAEVVLG